MSDPASAAAPEAAPPSKGPAGPATLFARDVQVAVLASGSTGNCTYIGDGHAGVLVDCGISTRQVLKRMEALGLADAPVDAVLITHEHTDHVAAARILCDRLYKKQGRWVPFLMTEGTRRNLKPKAVPAAIEQIEAGVEVQVKHLTLDPFRIPHDVDDPVAWRVRLGGHWVGVVTDLGRPTTLVQDKLRDLAIAVLEFNHDFDMLMDGAYPWHLKQRIRSSHGHLSNDQAAELLSAGMGEDLQELVLAHLSEENNAPERALAAAHRSLSELGAVDRVRVRVGHPKLPQGPVSVRARDW